jgi:hypothetical protein
MDDVGLTLNSNDPFEKLLIPIVETNRKKRADYADEENIYKNFDYVEKATMGMVNATDYADIMVTMKSGRIMNLRSQLTKPQNESLLDTYLDRAVYAILAYGLALRDSRAAWSEDAEA